MTAECSNEPGEDLLEFFRRFEQGSSQLDMTMLGECFADTFIAGDALTSFAVPRAAFLQALPQRAAKAAEAGLEPAALQSMHMHVLDEHWVLARTQWTAERAGREPLAMSSSYLLHRTDAGLRIVAYLNHEGLPLRSPGQAE